MIEQKGLLETIRDELGEDIETKVEEMSYKSNIYVLSLVDIIEVTKESLKVEFASYKLRFPDRSWNSFMKFKRNWKEDKFSFVVEPQGYFIDKATAVDYAERNIGDVNEAGAYPYIVVSSMPLNRVHPTVNFREHILFLFNSETRRYEEISWDYSKGTKLLEERGCSGLY